MFNAMNIFIQKIVNDSMCSQMTNAVYVLLQLQAILAGRWLVPMTTRASPSLH